MSLNLLDRVKPPQTKWFHWADSALGLKLVEEKDAVFSIETKYQSSRDQRRMIEESITRNAANDRGAKIHTTGDDVYREDFLRYVIRHWKLTVRGLYLLETEIDVTDLNPDEVIELNDDNLGIMAHRSKLPNLLTALMKDHAAWFGKLPEDEGDELGNSRPGESLSLGKSPVASA